jgi:hypothetical protein
MTKWEEKIKGVGNQCEPQLAKHDMAKAVINKSMELLVVIAWGTKPPQNSFYKNGWLESSHLALFCKFKRHMNIVLGEEAWNDFVNSLLESLPGASELGRNEAWARTIMSDSCKYPI